MQHFALPYICTRVLVCGFVLTACILDFSMFRTFRGHPSLSPFFSTWCLLIHFRVSHVDFPSRVKNKALLLMFPVAECVVTQPHLWQTGERPVPAPRDDMWNFRGDSCCIPSEKQGNSQTNKQRNKEDVERSISPHTRWAWCSSSHPDGIFLIFGCCRWQH